MSTIRTAQDPRVRTIAFFEAGATDYLAHATSEPDFRERFALFEEQIAIVRQHLPATPRCLDLGCGPGSLSLAARRQGFSVIGIDGSRSMLEHARSFADGQRLDIDFRQASLPLAEREVDHLERSADLILASSIIEYLPDNDLFAKQCRRLLAPGGIALVSFANERSVYRRIERRLRPIAPAHSSYMTVQERQHDETEARQVFRGAGLATEAVHYFGLPRPLYGAWHSARRPPWLATLFLLVLRRGPDAR
jgi:2-polyprenyl-3-methyl-5-hydroxy-6-metoxy-1,4-benzoquinol methylase